MILIQHDSQTHIGLVVFSSSALTSSIIPLTTSYDVMYLVLLLSAPRYVISFHATFHVASDDDE